MNTNIVDSPAAQVTVDSVTEYGELLEITNRAGTTMWTLDGILHRGGNKPAWLKEDKDGRVQGAHYLVHGISHRSDGPWTGNNTTGYIGWALFGQKLPEPVFIEITTHSRNNSCPLILSWLLVNHLISDEQLEKLNDEALLQLPIDWILKTANVNKEDLFIALWKANLDSVNRWYFRDWSRERLLKDKADQILLDQEQRFDAFVKVASFVQRTNPVA